MSDCLVAWRLTGMGANCDNWRGVSWEIGCFGIIKIPFSEVICSTLLFINYCRTSALGLLMSFTKRTFDPFNWVELIIVLLLISLTIDTELPFILLWTIWGMIRLFYVDVGRIGPCWMNVCWTCWTVDCWKIGWLTSDFSRLVLEDCKFAALKFGVSAIDPPLWFLKLVPWCPSQTLAGLKTGSYLLKVV